MPTNPSVPPAAIEAQLQHLASMPANWDTYGAVPITAAALDAARQWLKSQYVWPRSNGGLMLGVDEDGQAIQIGPDGTFVSHDEEDDPAYLIRAWIEGLSEAQLQEVIWASEEDLQRMDYAEWRELRAALLKLAEPKEP